MWQWSQDNIIPNRKAIHIFKSPKMDLWDKWEASLDKVLNNFLLWSWVHNSELLKLNQDCWTLSWKKWNTHGLHTNWAIMRHMEFNAQFGCNFFIWVDAKQLINHGWLSNTGGLYVNTLHTIELSSNSTWLQFFHTTHSMFDKFWVHAHG